MITFNIQDHELKFTIEIKQEIRLYQLENNHKNYMIVAQRIFPEVKKQFRKQNTACLEELVGVSYPSAAIKRYDTTINHVQRFLKHQYKRKDILYVK